MSAKVANVIAVELGLLIAILSWLAFSNSSRLKPPALVEELRAPENSLAMVRPVPRQQQFQSPATYAANPQPQLSTGVQPAVQTNQGLQYGGMDYYGQSPARPRLRCLLRSLLHRWLPAADHPIPGRLLLFP